MPTQLLVLKTLASVGGAVAVGGGSYVVYQNSDSIKKFFNAKTQGTANSTERPTAPTESNLFLVRYKSDKPTTDVAIAVNAQLTCDYDSVSKAPCKIYKFNTNKKTNSFTSEEIKDLVAATNTSEFTTSDYFAIELTGVKKRATDLHNKSFTVKSGETTQGKFDFDQLIFGQAGQDNATASTRTDETYIVKKASGWSNPTTEPTSYACKLTAAATKVDNFDFGCSLVQITQKTNGDKITEFAHLKSLNNKFQAASLKDATDTYYKLIVNSTTLYNLDFSEATPTSVQLVLISEAKTDIGTLDIQQKLVEDKFIGKTDLLLAQVVSATTGTSTELTAATCSFASTVPVIDTNKIPCTLYKATEAADKSIAQLTLGTTAIQASDTFTANDFYTIKLDPAKNIGDFADKKQIFYHIPITGSTPNHKTVTLNISALMSGDTTSTHKPMFITEPTITTTPKTQE